MNRHLVLFLALMVVGFSISLTAKGETVKYNNWEVTESREIDSGDYVVAGEFTVSGSSEVSLLLNGDVNVFAKNLRIGNVQSQTGLLALGGNSVLSVTNEFNIGRRSLSIGCMTIKDNARLELLSGNRSIYLSGSWNQYGDHRATEAMLVLEGGAIDGPEWGLGFSGTNSIALFRGGASDFGNWSFNGDNLGDPQHSDNAYTNRMIVSGGTHKVNEIKLNEANRNSLLRMEGGKISVGNNIALGALAGDHVIELVGGELSFKSLSVAGESGKVYADGGTIVDAGMSNVPKFVLGSKGLTVLAANQYPTINQSFEDATDVDGKFIKKGPLSATISGVSSHSITEVNEGELVMKANEFGRKIVVQNNGRVSIGSGTKLAVDHLVLGGEDGSAGILKPGVEGTSLTVGTLTVNCGVVDLANVESGGVILASENEIDADCLSKLHPLATYEEGKDYVFSLGEDKKSIVFAIADLDDSVNTTITESMADDTARTLKGMVSVSGGASVFTGAVDLMGYLTFNIESGSSLALAETFTAYADVRKLGGGRLILEGNVAHCSGNWTLENGVLDVNNQNAFGKDASNNSVVALTSGTLRFGEGDPTEVEHKLKISTIGEFDRVIVSTDRELRFCNGIDSVQGTFIKTGKGTLNVEFGNGTYKLGTRNQNNGASGGTGSLPDDGSSPDSTAAKNTMPLEILDGEVALKGDGVAVSKIQQTQPLFIGTSWTGAVVQAGLLLENIYYNQGGASRPLIIGNGKMPDRLNRPYLRVRNSELRSNTITLGNNNSMQYPVLEVENSLVQAYWAIYLGSENNDLSDVHPCLRLGAGAILKHHRDYDTGGSQGIWLRRNVDGVVSNGATIVCVENKNSANSGVGLRANASGMMTFIGGGVLETYKFTDENTSAEGANHVDFVFDGGVLRMTKNGDTKFIRPQQGFTTTGDGMEINLGEGVTHKFACSFRGDGAIVKTGAGTLVFGMNGGNASVTNDGGVVVREGVMKISGNALGENVGVNVTEGATLDLGGDAATASRVGGVHGAGVVVNGLLTGAIQVDVDQASVDNLITLGDGVSVQNVGFKVKFVYADEEAVKKSGIPVCRLGAGVTVDCSAWKGTGLPEGLGAEFKVTDGIVYATIKSVGGTVLILR